MSRIGVYPGTFDPITNGHVDIIERSLKLVDQLIIGIATNSEKNPLFELNERVELVKYEVNSRISDPSKISVISFNQLLMDFVVSCKANIIIRGLRAVSDFEYEFQMAGMNSYINPSIETVFLMASDRHQFISSRFVKEIGKLGGDISHFVSPYVASRVHPKK